MKKRIALVLFSVVALALLGLATEMVGDAIPESARPTPLVVWCLFAAAILTILIITFFLETTNEDRSGTTDAIDPVQLERRQKVLGTAYDLATRLRSILAGYRGVDEDALRIVVENDDWFHQSHLFLPDDFENLWRQLRTGLQRAVRLAEGRPGTAAELSELQEELHSWSVDLVDILESHTKKLKEVSGVSAPTPEELLVDINYPSDSGMQSELQREGYEIAWCREAKVRRKLDLEGWEHAFSEDGKILRSGDLVLLRKPKEG